MRTASLWLWVALATACGSTSTGNDAGNALREEDADVDDDRGHADAADADREGDDDAGSEPATSSLSYWKDAKSIIDAKCAICHVDGGIGPMPLTTYREVEDYRPLIQLAVRDNVMPPWTANVPVDYVVGDRRLSPEQKDTLLTWLSEGAHEGDPDDEPDAVLVPAKRALDRVDLSLEMPEAYSPVVEPDDYRCFVMEIPVEAKKYITGISIEPDKKSMVHHAILYYASGANAQAARDRDEAEEGPGYGCFTGGGTTAAWLQSYEPGGYGQSIPGGLGFEVLPESVLILQVHYNTLNGVLEDRSRVDLTLEDAVARVGFVNLIVNPEWLSGEMPIPLGNKHVEHSFVGRGTLVPATFGIYWVDLHMHQLGSSGRIGIVRADKPMDIEMLLEIPKWDFKWQETYVLTEPNVLNPGDKLFIECTYDNSEENQPMLGGERLPSRDVNWGDGTRDEMCLGNVLLTPM